MSIKYLLCFFLLLSCYLVRGCSAAAHAHSGNSLEREVDGAGGYGSRHANHEHYTESGHNVQFDHLTILGSVKEAEEFEKLSTEESKLRLAALVMKMDKNEDNFLDIDELTAWIQKSFQSLSKEEAVNRMKQIDTDEDEVVTWKEYYTAAGEEDDPLEGEDTSENALLHREEREMWGVADANGDGVLDAQEFEVLLNPEEHAVMHSYLVNQTLREKDLDKDGLVSFEEYMDDRGSGMQHDAEQLLAERDRFQHELDLNADGHLDRAEVLAWIVPDNNEIALEDAEQMIQQADDNRDGRLSMQEIIDHHEVFVGNQGDDDYYENFLGEHFDDEL